MTSRFPGVTLEEAETVAEMLGYNIAEEAHISMAEPVLQGTADLFIFNLLGGMFGDFEEGYEGKTWADCPPAARAFYERASALELRQ